MSAVFAQFTTPFQISDMASQSYSSTMHVRVPRDPSYTPPSPDRPRRGWIVMRQRAGGGELFRGEVNLLMDGGVGIGRIESDIFANTLTEVAARINSITEEMAVTFVDRLLQRIESFQSPWMNVRLYMPVHGIECFHEDVEGRRTNQSFVVDLRLERID